MQSARLGMVRAAQEWQPKRGRFTTFAWWKIRHELQEAVTKDIPLRAKGDMPRPTRVHLRKSTPAPPMAESALEDQEQRELANALVEDLTAEERTLLFGGGGDEAARELLLTELRSYFEVAT